jgi:acid phosphatase family membrane protein YuiD
VRLHFHLFPTAATASPPPSALCSAFVAAFLGFFFAQVAKVFTHHYITREWDLTRLVGSGGMPSSHTSLVMGLTTALGIINGTSSPYFAIALVFSLIVSTSNFLAPLMHRHSLILSSFFLFFFSLQVMYDATGVRLHAGKQASVLNMIITELPPDHPVSSSTGQLKDTLGHTPLQVAVGAIVGMIMGYIIGLLYTL